MRVMRASELKGYEYLELVDLPKPDVSDGKVLVRMTAAGVTPLDHTILSGQYHGAKAPLVLGNEGAGVVEESPTARRMGQVDPLRTLPLVQKSSRPCENSATH